MMHMIVALEPAQHDLSADDLERLGEEDTVLEDDDAVVTEREGWRRRGA